MAVLSRFVTMGNNQHYSPFMTPALRVLVVEDSIDDAELLLWQLRRGGYAVESLRVDDRQSASAAMERKDWDLIIADFVIPGFGGMEALELYKQKGLDAPFIVLSGHIGEDMAVRMMKAGAHDCIMKDKLARLVPAVERELREAATRRLQREVENALRESEERFRELADNIDSAFFMFERGDDGNFGRVLFASAAYERVWGTSLESLYQDAGAWLAGVHPDDVEAVRRNVPAMSSGAFEQEFRVRSNGGEMRWVHFRTFPVLHTGSVCRIAAIAQDVTRRKEADRVVAAYARQMDVLVEELNAIDWQLHQSNREVAQSRQELERRVRERTAGLAVVNAQLQKQIRERTQIEGELIEMADRERRRRGMDTHAKLSQKLMGISFMVKALERKVLRKHLPRVVETRRIQNLLNEVINHSDDLAQDFGSLDLRGDDLARELRSLAASMRKVFQISCHFSVKGVLPKLPQNVAQQIYKIAQDAAGNAIKNGHANEVSLRLTAGEGCARLEVKDNGVHFPASRMSQDGMGWRIMHSRANLIGASLHIQPQAEQGMMVTCLVPVAIGQSPEWLQSNAEEPETAIQI